MSLRLEIVTPEAQVYSQEVDGVIAPTAEGDINVLPGHIPLISILEAGELEVQQNGSTGTTALAVDRGYLQVAGDKVSILTEAAIDVEDIDLDEAHQARERAAANLEKAKNDQEMDPEEMERLEAQFRFAMAREISKGKRKN